MFPPLVHIACVLKIKNVVEVISTGEQTGPHSSVGLVS